MEISRDGRTWRGFIVRAHVIHCHGAVTGRYARSDFTELEFLSIVNDQGVINHGGIVEALHRIR